MEQVNKAQDRDRLIVRTSVIGILANVLLAAFKAGIGILANSIAITLDAVNNLSDALSSVITIIGTKLAAKAPDKKHPIGYGRIEYLSASIIAAIVLYAGISSLTESVRKILHPVKPDYTAAALVIVAAAVVVKVVLGQFFIRRGESVNSDSLVNSGKDAKNDAVLSLSTLAAALIFLFTNVSIEAWLGVVISAVIIKSGIDMLRETVSEILGERVDAELAKKIKAAAASFDDVSGAYDLVVHSYGPNRLLGSLHIEVPDYYTADRIDDLTRRIVEKVYRETGVILTGVGIYSTNTKEDRAKEIEKDVRRIALEDPYALQVHGFYVVPDENRMQFDVVISYDAPDRTAVCEQIRGRVQEAFPEYRIRIQPDADLSD